MASISTVAKVDALLEVLDRDIEHAEASLSLLDTLRVMLIKRDDAAMEELMGDLHRQAEFHAENERRREELRRDLAGELGCTPGEMTLSALKDKLSGPRQQAVAQRQTRLKKLTLDLKREYALTSMLLADCARFNRSLINVFFGVGGKGQMTYGANGTAKRQGTTALVNMHL